MIHGREYGAFNGEAEQEIECQACKRYYAVEFTWNGESWEPRHNAQADADGFHCNTVVFRDKSEWRKCVFCDHVNAIETTSDPDEPTQDVPVVKPSPFLMHLARVTEAYGKAYRAGVL